jgi:hypothetical protein
MNPTLQSRIRGIPQNGLTAIYRRKMRRHSMMWRAYLKEREPELAFDHLQCAILWQQMALTQSEVDGIAREAGHPVPRSRDYCVAVGEVAA